MKDKIHNLNIETLLPLISPNELKALLPFSPAAETTVLNGRNELIDVLSGKDSRFLVITGPCSIHDPNAALEYANRLASLREKLGDKLLIIMRVYFEKPRTTIGWKGMINDPDMDGSCHVEKGLKLARQLLLKINELGIPTATEVLDPISPQYISELITWASIGARTTESQTHREMASGLSMPVGFKNSTDGSVDVACAAMEAAKNPHSFIGIDQDGHTSVVRTKGNSWGHVILRGGHSSPNYHPESIKAAVEQLQKKSMLDRILVDCSHANSDKKQENQGNVLGSVVEQVSKGNKNILGVMLESNLKAGNQKIPADLSQLKYGISVTDECMDWDTTVELLTRTHKTLS